MLTRTLVSSLLLLAVISSPVFAAEKPNIVLIMADDLAAECLSAYGALDDKTPHLNDMAARGVKFDRCFSTPLCTPSRVQLMTGRYTHRNYKRISHRNDGLVDFTDFVPTLCELAGAKLPADRIMDGKSLVRACKGETAETDRNANREVVNDAGEASPEQKPNVVLIFADDMGWGDVGYHGYEDVLTPNIDRIAAEGVHFRQGYVSASVCGPSRAGLMTGVYQQRFGAGENASATGYPDKMEQRFRMSGLPTSQPTLAEMLRPAGYRCGMVGKWHLGVEKPLRPHYRGFHFFWGFLNGSHDYTAWNNEFANRKDKWPIFRNDKMLPPAEGVYLTDLFSDRAVNFINHNPEKPFFLYLAYNAVHHPWQVPEKYLERTLHLSNVEDRRFFAAMILAMDDGIGRVLKTLDDTGIADNTIVVFLSDNGSPRGQGLKHAPKDNLAQRQETALMSNPGPHRGFKGDTYEGGIRVPFAIRWPGKIRAETRYDHPVSALDIAPTILATVGVTKPPRGHPFDGVNLLPFLNGLRRDARPHDVMYWRRDNDYAIREGDWKLQWNDASGSMSIKLFNLASDPGEFNDLVEDHPQRAQAMQDKFDTWDNRMPDSRPWGGPGNRNRRFPGGARVDVAKYNLDPPRRPPAKVRSNNGASNYLGEMNRSHNPIFHNRKIVSDFYSQRGISNDEVNHKGVLVKDTENYLTDALGQRAVDFIEANRDNPFLCYLPFNAIHGPFQAPQELVVKYDDEPDEQRRLVKAMLDSMDQNIGKVLDALRRNGLEENTLVVFLSDNGGHEASPNKPLRGKKGTFWEGGLRVPFCMQWKGKIPAGRTCKQPVISLDLMPTFITAAGGNVDPAWRLDGTSLLPLVRGEQTRPPRDALYWAWGARKAIRAGNMKAMSSDGGRTWQLYNLAQDISEQHDLAGIRAQQLKSFIEQHSKWESTLMPQQWGWNQALGYKDPSFGKPKPYHDSSYFE